jgi:pilus assembly protein Flp/PilA
MTRLVRGFCGDESGTTAVEYALIAICIAVVIVASVQALGLKLNSIFTDVEAGFEQGSSTS